MNNTNIHINAKSIPNWEHFQNACSIAWEKISGMAPSDSFVDLSVDEDKECFLVKFYLASQEFKFSVQNASVSPFAALEIGLKDSINRIRRWSLTRHLQINQLTYKEVL